MLGAFINETLRVYTPADGLIPRVATVDHQVGEFKIPKGHYVDVCM
jgi:cytochrome P450